ncbi:hypothetical protein ACWEDZ_02830 [Streptomyces sp. NPDC005047]
MDKMTCRDALELAHREKAAGRSGELLFGGRGTRKNPKKDPVLVTVTELPRATVELRNTDGGREDYSRTGVVMWFAAPGAGAAEEKQEQHA